MTDRKIIQIACAEAGDGEAVGGTLYALADDGSVWFMLDPWKGKAPWKPLPQLPQKSD
jgi:hypothetical protein